MEEHKPQVKLELGLPATRPQIPLNKNLKDSFDPESHGLTKDFLLTNFSDLKG